MAARKGSHCALRFCDDSVEIMPKFSSFGSFAWAAPAQARPAIAVLRTSLRMLLNISILLVVHDHLSRQVEFEKARSRHANQAATRETGPRRSGLCAGSGNSKVVSRSPSYSSFRKAPPKACTDPSKWMRPDLSATTRRQ